jgi:hypothetical protein
MIVERRTSEFELEVPISAPRNSMNKFQAVYKKEARGSVVVEALCYKPEGRGIECQ